MQSTTMHRIIRAMTPTGLRTQLLAALAIAGVMTAACDVHGVSDVGLLASISVTPNATLRPNETQQMVVEARDADNRVFTVAPTGAITWSVVSGGGTISATGLFTAGTTTGVFPNTVRATIGGVSGSASITVIAGPLATIVVAPTPVTLAVTTTQQFTAIGRDASGNIVQFTPTWSVVASGGAIAQTGVFTAGAVVGTYTNTVQASNQGITGFATVIVTVGPLATITVTPNPATLIVTTTQQFVAVGRDAAGNLITIAPVWSVAALGGTINSAGLFTAGNTPGTFPNTIVATSGTMTGRATVIVTAGPLATITVTPNPATMAINGTQQFTAVGSDVGGNPVVITPTWAIVASGGTISTTGLFTAGTQSGTFSNTVRATSGTVSGFATVIVTSGPLATITVTPNPVFMPTTSTQQFVAVGRDASGNVFIIAPVWSVVNGGGSINASGLFTSGAVAGPFLNTVQATSGTISGTATVTVNPPLALTTITVTPNPASVQVLLTQQFTAVGRDQNNNIFPMVPVWSVTAGGGAINAGTGLFTAGGVAGAFANTVRATSGLVFGTATVNVTAAPPGPSPLNTAANFGIISGAAITCGTPGTPGAVSGLSSAANIGSSNNTYVGFPPLGPCTLDGIIPLAGVIQTAQNDLTTHYVATQRAPGACALVAPFPAGTNLTGLDLGSVALLNLPPGNYCFSAGAILTGTLQLSGPAAAIWNFTMESTLGTAVASNMVIVGGGINDNVYWAVGSSATLGTNSNFRGNIMAQAGITLNAGATLNGRALARTAAVDMTAGGARIIKP